MSQNDENCPRVKEMYLKIQQEIGEKLSENILQNNNFYQFTRNKCEDV